MKTSTPYPTVDDFEKFVETYIQNDPYKIARKCAILSGWDGRFYKELLVKYLKSIEVVIGANGESAKDTKGDPLENLSRYLLEKGGLSRKVEALKKNGKWEIDGYGDLIRENLYQVLGDRDTNKAGNDFILECKNYKNSIGSNEFTKYKSRMDRFEVNFGVFISTSGFSIEGGLGIAEDLYIDFKSGKIHILLTVQELCLVHIDNIPILHIIKQSISNSRFDIYTIDKEIQKKFSSKYCHEIADLYLKSIDK